MKWGKILDYTPGVGLVTHTVREYKSRKGKKPWYNLKESKDRKALVSYVVQTGYIALAIGWKVYAGSYLGKGISTGDWNPFRFDSKEKVEKIIQEKTDKKNDLEKTLNCKEFFK